MAQNTEPMRDLQKIFNQHKTGNVCHKHSLRIKGAKIQSKEIVPFDEELGVYPIDMVQGRTEEFCPECRRIEKIKPVEREFQSKASSKNSVKDSSGLLKSKSVINDETIKQATFNNFKEVDEGTRRLKHEAFEMANEILNGSTSNYLLCGNFGTGKSHLGMAIAEYVNKESYKLSISDINRRPFRVVFLSISEMLDRIYKSYNMPIEQLVNYRHTKEHYNKIMKTYDLVVFDDLGAELGRLDGKVATDNMVKVLNSFLEIRMDKATVITSNFDFEQIHTNYDGRLSSRVKSGLKGNVLVFNDTGDKRGGI